MYKRQGIDDVDFAIHAILNHLSEFRPTLRTASAAFIRIDLYEFLIGAVSYTHLDVYKRQKQHNLLVIILDKVTTETVFQVLIPIHNVKQRFRQSRCV